MSAPLQPQSTMSWPHNPFTGLPNECFSIVLSYLDLDDIAELCRAFDEENRGMFDWMAIVKPELKNILENKSFCTAVQKDDRRSLTPANLMPSSESGLPTHRTYSNLQTYSTIHKDRLQTWKRKDTASLRKKVLFHSKDFRHNLDVPSARSKTYLGIVSDSTATYHQLLESLPQGPGHERTRFESCRIRDDQVNRAYQKRQLELVLLRMYEDQDYLDRTCRKCFVHTSKREGENTYNLFHGVVYCNKCYSIVTAEAAIPLDRFLNFDLTIDCTGCAFKTFNIDGVPHISKADADLFARCFIGMKIDRLLHRFPTVFRPYAQLKLHGKYKKQTKRYNFCSKATVLAIKWYIQGEKADFDLGHHLPRGLNRKIMTKTNEPYRPTRSMKVLEIYNFMARLYDDMPARLMNERQAVEVQRTFAARFWHYELYTTFGLMVLDVLQCQLKMPIWLLSMSTYLLSPTLTYFIPVSQANEFITFWFGQSLGQLAPAMHHYSKFLSCANDVILMSMLDLTQPEDEINVASAYALMVVTPALKSKFSGDPAISRIWPHAYSQAFDLWNEHSGEEKQRADTNGQDHGETVAPGIPGEDTDTMLRGLTGPYAATSREPLNVSLTERDSLDWMDDIVDLDT